MKKADKAKAKVVRCAIYTRKSTEEGLNQEFNSLDAQREAGEAFIASQKHEGWTLLPRRYDDGGFSGGNAERPALQRLMQDVAAGEIDCVVVYKVDRLSRSLLDFAKLMGTFEEQNVAFVSVTQQFNTNHSMGRLTLNILLSFAQFEREIIGERIRDKLSAQARKGKWKGGIPVLGYDVDRSTPTPKLVVNNAEAIQVREIFELYLSMGSLLLVATELNDRGWFSKRWTTKSGRKRGGVEFDKNNLHALLTNPIYIGKIRHRDDVFNGEHASIVEPALFFRVAERLKRNAHLPNPRSRNKYGSLLKGLLYCRGCGRAMTHTYNTARKRRYRYYTCISVLKQGRAACPSRSLPASEIEKAVVDQVRCIAKDPALRRAVFDETQVHLRQQLEECRLNLAVSEREIKWLEEELKQTTQTGSTDSEMSKLAAELQERLSREHHKYGKLSNRVTEMEAAEIKASDIARTMENFDNLWSTLSPKEQWHMLSMLIQRVEFDATESSFEIFFEDAGIAALSHAAEGSAR